MHDHTHSSGDLHGQPVEQRSNIASKCVCTAETDTVPHDPRSQRKCRQWRDDISEDGADIGFHADRASEPATEHAQDQTQRKRRNQGAKAGIHASRRSRTRTCHETGEVRKFCPLTGSDPSNFKENGAPERTRTSNPQIRSHKGRTGIKMQRAAKTRNNNTLNSRLNEGFTQRGATNRRNYDFR